MLELSPSTYGAIIAFLGDPSDLPPGFDKEGVVDGQFLTKAGNTSYFQSCKVFFKAIVIEKDSKL